MREWEKREIEGEVFKTMESLEAKSLTARMQEMKRSLNMQEEKENTLQKKYADLKAEREKLQKMVQSLTNGQ